MADRELPDLRSRVRIDTDDIAKADRAAKQLGDTVRKQGDAAEPLQRGLRVSREEMAQFGASMTRNVTLPMVTGAAVALKMSSDFETTFTQMQGLAGVTADEVDGLRQSVLDLSGETARSPQDVAEGLYFIRSAGLDGAAAMEALDVSAKAAAVGLGQTQQVADAVTSAVNSYGQENLSAAAAADVLTAAVREGKGEASAMAPQLGRLLPIAAELGVEFGEVAGGLSFLTRGNGDAAQSATQLNGVLQKILRPTEQAKEALAGVGLSGEELRRIVDEQGLLPALQLLEERMGTNSDAFKAVFDDTEGLTGALALLRDGGTEAAGVIDSVTNSSGDLAEAFDGLSESDAFKAKQALAELQATAVEAGAKMAPALTDIVGLVGDVVGVFGDLPSGVQTAILVFGGVAAALGPIVSVGTSAATALRAVQSASLGATRAGGVFAAAAIGVTLLAGSFINAKVQAEQAEAAIDGIVDAANAAGESVDQQFGRQLARTFAGLEGGLAGKGVEDAIEGLKELGFTIEEISAGFTGSQENFEAFRRSVAQRALDSDVSWANDLADGFATIRRTSREAEERQRAYESAQEDLGIAADDTTEAIVEQGGALDDSEGKVAAAAREVMALGEAYTEAEERLNSLTDSVLAGFDADLNYEDALRDLASARDEVFLAEEDIRINGWTPERQAALDEANQKAERSALDLSRAELARAEAHAEASGETLSATDRNQLLIDSLTRLGEGLAPDSPLRQRLDGMIADLREIAREHTATINIEVNEPELGLVGQAALGQLPTSVWGNMGFGATVGPNNIFGGGAPPAPRSLSMPKGPGAGTSVTVAPVIQVTGEPDAMTLKRLERVATDAVRKGINDAGAEVGQW